jgi:hypothetical protein
MKKITISLFGTCGSSKWRDQFIKEYDKQGISYFNPLKKDWKPEDAQIEAEHLCSDEILLFPITNETYAFGSLAETGFSILQVIKLNQKSDIIVMIDPEVKIDKSGLTLAEILMVNAQTKDSIRARALVMTHLKKLDYTNVWIVKDLNNMLKLSLHLHALQVLREGAKKYTL